MSILVTGVSSGIGLATANQLLNEGYKVYGTVRKAEDAKRLGQKKGFTTLIMDLTDRESIKQAIQQIDTEVEPLTAVVNNAGIAVSGPLETLSEEQYRQQFDVNVFGLLAVCQEALPLLHKARQQGETNVKIVNVSSISGYVVSLFTAIYSASKFAVEAITDGLRRELMDVGIDVVSIAPGPVKTPIWEKAKVQKEAYIDTRYEYVLDKLNDYANNSSASGIAPEKVADTIVKAIQKERPRPDQIVMNKKWMINIVRLLPKRRQDKTLRKLVESSKRY